MGAAQKVTEKILDGFQLLFSDMGTEYLQAHFTVMF